MKHLLSRTLTSFVLALISLATTAPAQSAPVIKVNVPFEFTFGDRTFLAGDYSLARPEQHLLALRDSRGRMIDWVLTERLDSLAPAASTELKFDSSEGKHILTEVWLQEQTSGERLAPVKDNTFLVKHHSTEARDTSEGSQP
jgi:hypothetical protein